MALHERLDPVLIEAGDQVGNGIPALATGQPCRALEACAIGDSEESFGASYLTCRFSAGSAEVFEVGALIEREGA